jgi:GT2 family glycosyltransferase
MMSEAQVILSVVIVAYRSREEIGECLRSIPQSLMNHRVEVVVVDNYQEDGLAEFIEENFPFVAYLASAENLGFGKANNLGYQQSSGKYVLFLNPDTICNEGALIHCLMRLEGEPLMGLISPKLVMEDGDMDLACRRSIPSLWDGFCRASGLASKFPKIRIFAGYNLTYMPEEKTYDVGAINGAFMMTRRIILEEVGLFDEAFFMYGDDLDLCYRIGLAGHRIVYDGRVSITHLKGLSVAKEYDAMSRAIFDANKAFFLKHFNKKNRWWIGLKYELAFGLWKWVALVRAKRKGYRGVKPV